MSLQSLLNQTISVYPKSGYDAYGRETVGSATSYTGRVQEVTKSRLLPNGQTVVIDAIVYLQGESSIMTNDRVDYDGTRYKVYGRSLAIDGQGNINNTKLELVKWTDAS